MTNRTSKLVNDMEVNLLISFASVQVIVGSTANFFVIILFATRRELRRKNSDLLILHVALADFISLTTFLPWNIYLTNVGKGEYTEYYTSLNTFCLFLSGTAVLTVAVDKYVAVVYPLRYASFITRSKTLLMIFGSWLVAIALIIAHFFDALYGREHHHILDKALSALVLVKMLFVASLYTVVFKAVKNQLSARVGRNIQNNPNSLQIISKREKMENIFLKSALNTFIVVCLFYATYLPYAVLQMMSISDFMTWRKLFSFIYINACINPFVYFFRMRRFRVALLYTFNKRRRLDMNVEVFLSTNKVSSIVNG